MRPVFSVIDLCWFRTLVCAQDHFDMNQQQMWEQTNGNGWRQNLQADCSTEFADRVSVLAQLIARAMLLQVLQLLIITIYSPFNLQHILFRAISSLATCCRIHANFVPTVSSTSTSHQMTSRPTHPDSEDPNPGPISSSPHNPDDFAFQCSNLLGRGMFTLCQQLV